MRVKVNRLLVKAMPISPEEDHEEYMKHKKEAWLRTFATVHDMNELAQLMQERELNGMSHPFKVIDETTAKMNNIGWIDAGIDAECKEVRIWYDNGDNTVILTPTRSVVLYAPMRIEYGTGLMRASYVGAKDDGHCTISYSPYEKAFSISCEPSKDDPYGAKEVAQRWGL